MAAVLRIFCICSKVDDGSLAKAHNSVAISSRLCRIFFVSGGCSIVSSCLGDLRNEHWYQNDLIEATRVFRALLYILVCTA